MCIRDYDKVTDTEKVESTVVVADKDENTVADVDTEDGEYKFVVAVADTEENENKSAVADTGKDENTFVVAVDGTEKAENTVAAPNSFAEFLLLLT